MTGQLRQRLHPLTPVLKGARTLAAVIAAISWQGYARLGFANWLATVAAGLVVVLIGSVVSWSVTGYRLTGRELRIQEGLIWRRSRVIPLERVQSVNIVQPVLARLFGLAEVQLEVIGGRQAEGNLAFLPRHTADSLRHQLISLAADARGEVGGQAAVPVAFDGPAAPGPATGSAAPAPPGPATGSTVPDASAGAVDGPAWPAPPWTADQTIEPAERPVHAVANRDVLLGQLMTVPTWLVPPSLAVTALPLLTGSDWSFVGVASTLTALVGVAGVPVRRVLSDWDFRISTDPTGLRLRHGLLETRSETVPPHRVQAVSVVRPLLWRWLDWHRTRIDVAGYGASAQSGAGTLLPVGDPEITRTVVDLVLAAACGETDDQAGSEAGGAGQTAQLAMRPAPRQARWLAPVVWGTLGFALTDRLVAVRQGRLTRRLTVAPLVRVQSVRVVQGPVQRALGLADLHVDTAGGGLAVVARHRAEAEAYAMAEAVAAGARSARAAAQDRAAAQTRAAAQDRVR